MNAALTALGALASREVVRFVRQPSRVAAGVATPLLLWGFFASGFAGSIALPGAEGETGAGGVSYALFMLPGIATLVVVFSSIFAAMSLIEDRREGFLQSVLVSPAPWWSVVGAKALGGGLVAMAQAWLILLAAPLISDAPLAGLLPAAGAIGLTAIGVTNLGLAAAWWVNSSEGFHGVMNVVLMPMWLLSGAFFPSEGASGWLRVAMWCDPLRWPTEAMRAALGAGAHDSILWSWIGAFAFPIATTLLAAAVMRRRPGR